MSYLKLQKKTGLRFLKLECWCRLEYWTCPVYLGRKDRLQDLQLRPRRTAAHARLITHVGWVSLDPRLLRRWENGPGSKDMFVSDTTAKDHELGQVNLRLTSGAQPDWFSLALFNLDMVLCHSTFGHFTAFSFFHQFLTRLFMIFCYFSQLGPSLLPTPDHQIPFY